MKKILFLLTLTIVISCNSPHNGNSYDNNKMSVESEEYSNPTRFLSTDGKYRANVLGTKKVLEGTITNNATVATFKNVTLTITFYDANDNNVGSGAETIYESFPPNSTKQFKIKTSFPRGTKSVGWEIQSAENN